jgi:hypothetical protein
VDRDRRSLHNRPVATSFCFEHVFENGDPAILFELYFDPEHVAKQDAAVEIAEREIVEVTDDPDRRRRVSKVTPRRQLPALIRPFVPGRLHYIEEVVWHKQENRIAVEIRPSLLGGRSQISSTYSLESVGVGLVHRTYRGTVSVPISLVGGRIERGIVDDIGRSAARCAACMQQYLDRGSVVRRAAGS